MLLKTSKPILLCGKIQQNGKVTSCFVSIIHQYLCKNLVAGYYVNSSPLCDGSGLRLTFEGFDGNFDLNFEEEILTDKWTRGMVERTNTTVTGENMIRVINTVEELGVEETKDMHYKQEGIEVCQYYGC